MLRSIATWALLFTVLVVGCRPKRAATIEENDGAGGVGGAGGEGGFVEPPPPPVHCSTGDVHECSVYYEVGGVTNCFVGVQICVEGEWETCTDQESVDARRVELEAAGLLGGGGAGADSTSSGAGAPAEGGAPGTAGAPTDAGAAGAP